MGVGGHWQPQPRLAPATAPQQWDFSLASQHVDCFAGEQQDDVALGTVAGSGGVASDRDSVGGVVIVLPFKRKCLCRTQTSMRPKDAAQDTSDILTCVDVMGQWLSSGWARSRVHDEEPVMTADELDAGGTSTPESLESVWREFSGELRRFIVRRVSRPQDADDILQLVALRMVQNSDELRDHRTLLGWLFVVTRHAITDYYRAAAHRREVMTDDMPEQPAPDLTAPRTLSGH